MNSYLFGLVFATVFVTEITGDKVLFTISALVTRFHVLTVLAGAVLAFTAKMLAAVFIGNVVTSLSVVLVARVSAITFLVAALLIWFRKQDDSGTQMPAATAWPNAILAAFAAVFFSEWADAGQLSAVVLAARYHEPILIWCAATLALVAKGCLALTVGLALRRYLPRQLLRITACVVCLAMGILSILRA